MNQIYHWIGFAIFWIASIVSLAFFVHWIYKVVIDELGRRYQKIWWLAEFICYRKEFFEFHKTQKPRIIHKKIK